MNRLMDIIVVLAMILILSAGIIYALPTSIWFEVRTTQVLDSTVGTSPRMIVDRNVNREFNGEWVVSVLRVVPNGFEPVCTATGSNLYLPTNQFPGDLSLDWWTWPTQCNLQEGEYVVRTVWTIHVFDRFEKTVRAVSNLFFISPLPEEINDESFEGSPRRSNL